MAASAAAAAAASAASDTEDLISCGNCLEVEGYIINPLVLPCGDIFCEICLQGQQLSDNTVRCVKCKRDMKVLISDLPSALEGLQTFCDPCMMKGKKKMTAKSYCTKCDNKYCAEHEKVHDDVSVGHSMLRIEAYKSSSYAEELRFCDVHTSEPYSIGCNRCWTVFCPLCLSCAAVCVKGSPHTLMSLIELSSALAELLEPIKQRAEENMDELSSVVNKTTAMISQWDSETEKSLGLLRDTRDDQLNEIKAKYIQLEHDYLNLRTNTNKNMAEYLEGQAEAKLSQLHTQLVAIHSEISSKHVVDLVRGHRRLVNLMEELAGEKYPSGVFGGQFMLMKKADSHGQELALSLVPTDDIIIGPIELALPTSLELIREIKVNNMPSAVCQSNGHTFVGKADGNIDSVDEHGSISNLVNLGNDVIGLLVHDNKLYSLVSGRPQQVYVHDMRGQLLYTWTHADDRTSARQMAIVNNELVIADGTKQAFTIYSLTGQFVKDVPCDELDSVNLISVCQGGNNSIITTFRFKNQVLNVNLATGNTIWAVDVTDQPIGVVQYGARYVIVTRCGTNDVILLTILDKRTGEVVGRLTDPETRTQSSYTYDMCVDGDTLIIPRYREGAILYYKLKSDIR